MPEDPMIFLDAICAPNEQNLLIADVPLTTAKKLSTPLQAALLMKPRRYVVRAYSNELFADGSHGVVRFLGFRKES
jgi:hypothetical protein